MLKIRLKKVGRKKINAFRIIVTDARYHRDTNSIKADLGFYQPQNKTQFIKLNIAKYNTFIKQGAMPTKRMSKIYNLAIKHENNLIISKG